MKVVTIHGIANNVLDKTFNQHWIPWIKEELKEKNIDCFVPVMPDAWAPDYNFWKEEFEQIEIDEQDILIGHSGGCAFLVRWLGETQKKIKKLILVAPWKIQSEDFFEGENEMYDFKINRKISKNVGKIIIFTSDDEEEDGKESVRIYHSFLEGELIELKSHGHFIFGDMGTNEFPELLEKVLK